MKEILYKEKLTKLVKINLNKSHNFVDRLDILEINKENEKLSVKCTIIYICNKLNFTTLQKMLSQVWMWFSTKDCWILDPPQ